MVTDSTAQAISKQGGETVGEGSDNGSQLLRGARVHLKNISSPEERWPDEACNQLEISEPGFVKYHHFKMEGTQVVNDMIQQGDWMTRIDMKDAYSAIPIHRST